MSDDREERVKQRAYDIWEKEGRPAGRHDEHWDRARRELDDQDRGRKAEAGAPGMKSTAKRGGTKRPSGASAGETAGATAAPKSRSRSKAEA